MLSLQSSLLELMDVKKVKKQKGYEKSRFQKTCSKEWVLSIGQHYGNQHVSFLKNWLIQDKNFQW